ncbi:GTPase family protein, partial [Pseudomonas aeruginosa]
MSQTISHEQLLEQISAKVNKIRTYTPKVGVFGNSGVGKSSLCNALFGKEVAKISDVEACTRQPQEILIGSEQGGIVLVDVPGIGEDPEHQEEYTALYQSLAPELDLVLWAIKADDRNYASGLDAYKSVFTAEQAPPVLFVIT